MEQHPRQRGAEAGRPRRRAIGRVPAAGCPPIARTLTAGGGSEQISLRNLGAGTSSAPSSLSDSAAGASTEASSSAPASGAPASVVAPDRGPAPASPSTTMSTESRLEPPDTVGMLPDTVGMLSATHGSAAQASATASLRRAGGEGRWSSAMRWWQPASPCAPGVPPMGHGCGECSGRAGRVPDAAGGLPAKGWLHPCAAAAQRPWPCSHGCWRHAEARSVAGRVGHCGRRPPPRLLSHHRTLTAPVAAPRSSPVLQGHGGERRRSARQGHSGRLVCRGARPRGSQAGGRGCCDCGDANRNGGAAPLRRG